MRVSVCTVSCAYDISFFFQCVCMKQFKLNVTLKNTSNNVSQFCIYVLIYKSYPEFIEKNQRNLSQLHLHLKKKLSNFKWIDLIYLIIARIRFPFIYSIIIHDYIPKHICYFVWDHYVTSYQFVSGTF